jgi:hypothetical protein
LSATATATRLLGLGRATYGTGLIVAPGVFGRVWIGREAERPTAQLALRALGVRDAAMGAGILLTADDPDRQRPWLVGAAVSDLVDMAATLMAGSAIAADTRRNVAVFAAGSSIAHAILHSAQRRAPAAAD